MRVAQHRFWRHRAASSRPYPQLTGVVVAPWAMGREMLKIRTMDTRRATSIYTRSAFFQIIFHGGITRSNYFLDLGSAFDFSAKIVFSLLGKPPFKKDCNGDHCSKQFSRGSTQAPSKSILYELFWGGNHATL